MTGSYGTFGTGSGGFNLAYGGKSWGNFISANGMNTGRFLDGPEFTVMHDHGNQGNVFDRVDFKPSQADTINVNLGFTRSWFQTPNSYDAQNATAWSDWWSTTAASAPTARWSAHRISAPRSRRSTSRRPGRIWSAPHTVFTFGGFVRRDQFNYYPSANPFADLSRRSPERDRRPEPHPHQHRRPRGSVVRERHPQHQDRDANMSTRS